MSAVLKKCFVPTLYFGAKANKKHYTTHRFWARHFISVYGERNFEIHLGIKKKYINLIPQSEHSKFSVKKTSRFACKKQTWKIAKCWVISSFFFPAAAEDTSPLIACVLLCVSLIWKQLLVNCQGEDAETAPLQSTAVKILILFGQIPYDLHYIAAPLAQWVSRYAVVCWVKSASINL